MRSEKEIWSEANLRKALRKTTRHSESDLDLLIAHLKYSNRAFYKETDKSDDLCLLKFSKEPITQKEEATFVLTE